MTADATNSVFSGSLQVCAFRFRICGSRFGFNRQGMHELTFVLDLAEFWRNGLEKDNFVILNGLELAFYWRNV